MSPCIPSNAFLETVNLYQRKAEDAASQLILTHDKSQSLQRGGIQEWILPSLAQIGPSTNVDQARYESSGSWIYLALSGTNPGAEFSIELTGGKTFTKITPGTKIVGNFDGFNVTRTGSNSANTPARFVIGQTENADYTEEALVVQNVTPTVMSNGLIGYAQSYNAVAFGANIPVGVPSAIGSISIQGARGVRCYMTAGSVITAGSIRWWINSPGINTALVGTSKWFPSPNVETIVAGAAAAVSSDFMIGLNDNTFVYPEIYGYTNVALSGNITYWLEAL